MSQKDRIEELEKQAEMEDNISKLRDILPQLQEIRAKLLENLSAEQSKEYREMIHDELYSIRKIANYVNIKMNKIARSKIKRPSFK